MAAVLTTDVGGLGEGRQDGGGGGRVGRLAVGRGVDVALEPGSSVATTPSMWCARSDRPVWVATPSPAATRACITTMSSELEPIRGSNPASAQMDSRWLRQRSQPAIHVASRRASSPRSLRVERR